MYSNKIILKIILFTILILPLSVTKSQTFGFGCLGLSGFYAGFSEQQYSVDGLNQYIKANYYGPVPKSNVEFKKGTGYRVGANIFRAKFDKFFISAKGYYQFIKEDLEQSANDQSSLIKNKYQLSLNHWGLALDIGAPLFSIIDLKVVEGGIVFHDIEFTHTTFKDDNQLSEVKYEPLSSKVNYYVATGLIIHIIPDYISIEGTASYNFLKVDQLTAKSDLLMGPTKISNSISKGGLMTTVQLNIGFPL
ncbi:MAG: hypothetical protein GYA14_15555 [Ignavibacteria bacterium]|nr:hypothetical protein [Ignavibacteria bacterium]